MTYSKPTHLSALLITSALLLSACGGGGGGSTSAPPPPTPVADTTAPAVAFSATTLSVESGATGSSTLTATDAVGVTSGPSVTCTNGGRFNVTTNVFTAATVSTTTTSVCTATASDAAGNQGTATLTVTMTPAQPAVTVTLSGTITYDRVPLNKSTNGLDFDATFQQPIRSATVELLGSNGTVLAETTSGNDGTYSFSIDSGQDVRVRVKSEIVRTGTSEMDLRVVDNTSSNALYALDGSLIAVPRTNQTRDLNAGSGWGTTSYTGPRAAGSFAILDTMFEVTEQFRGVDADVDFPPLRVFWSENNRPVSGNIANGEVTTSFYSVLDGLSTVVILGAENTDTDEYDLHVVTHEYGHYFEDQLSRSDSIGGNHTGTDRLDSRVAFGEGFGNALAAIITTDDPTYRDSFGAQQASGFEVNAEANVFTSSGWYSEASVYSILYDLFDADNDAADTVSFGLTPFYETLVDPDYIATEAFTTIFSFLNTYETKTGVTPAGVTALKVAQDINGTGAFGIGETNNGGFADILPVYQVVAVDGTPSRVCTTNAFGTPNKHGNRRFLRFDITVAGTYRFNMDVAPGSSGTNPEFAVFKNGEFLANTFASTSGSDSAAVRLTPGTHIIEAFDRNGSTGGVCHNFTIER